MISVRGENAMKNNSRLSGYSSIVKAGRSRRGSILVFLIVLMVIFTVLGVGMVSMFGSSVLSVFGSNSARRANYMAESGLRYATSEVRNALSEDKFNTLVNLNNRTFQVFPAVESFNLAISPYFGSTTGTAQTQTGTNAVTVTFAGAGFPENFTIPSNAQLQVGSYPAQRITAPAAISKGATSVTFTLNSNILLDNGIHEQTIFHFRSSFNSGQPITINQGGSLSLDIPNPDGFGLPVKNGAFKDMSTGTTYQYQTALAQGGQVILNNVSWSGGSSATFTASADLSFNLAAGIKSTGSMNQTQNVHDDTIMLYNPGTSAWPQNNNNTVVTPFNDLSALDLSHSGSIVQTMAYISTGGTHAYWVGFQGSAGYYSADPEQASCTIGYHVVPLANSSPTFLRDRLRNSWILYNQLSYEAQTKVGWDLNLQYGVTGITFRWHESSSPGKYEGYGLSFMRYNQTSGCIGGYTGGDGIPNGIKPPGLSGKSLLVLWQQRVIGGVETKKWLAYAILGDPYDRANSQDPKVVGNQGWPDGIGISDDSLICVRIDDTIVGDQRVNNIKLFYGDASPHFDSALDRGFDINGNATNIKRQRYDPEWLDAGLFPHWPSNKFDISSGSTIAYWHPGAHSVDWYEYFTLASANPQPLYNSVFLVKNPTLTWAGDGVQLLNDACTVQTNYFTLGTYEPNRYEAGLHVMGNLGAYTLAVDDLSIQILGANE
jgi:nitrate reductase NapE component